MMLVTATRTRGRCARGIVKEFHSFWHVSTLGRTTVLVTVTDCYSQCDANY